MKLRFVIELDPVTKRWSAVFPELPGCASAGDTEDEAIANAEEALALWFEPAPPQSSNFKIQPEAIITLETVPAYGIIPL